MIRVKCGMIPESTQVMSSHSISCNNNVITFNKICDRIGSANSACGYLRVFKTVINREVIHFLYKRAKFIKFI